MVNVKNIFGRVLPNYILVADEAIRGRMGQDGAICVNHPRVRQRITLDDLRKRCPDRLQLAPSACTQAGTELRNDVLISNDSFAEWVRIAPLVRLHRLPSATVLAESTNLHRTLASRSTE
jgi:hypothetical protein